MAKKLENRLLLESSASIEKISTENNEFNGLTYFTELDTKQICYLLSIEISAFIVGFFGVLKICGGINYFN